MSMRLSLSVTSMFLLGGVALQVVYPPSLVSAQVAAAQAAPQNQAQNQALLGVLSKRHMDETASDLERIAGGRENLIQQLLSFRTYQGLPQVGVRAAKFLVSYADVPEVETAIKEDIRSADRNGLARVYAIHVDKISTPESRRRIAQVVLDKAQDQPDYSHFARNLLYSSDGEVKKLAQKAFP